MRKPYLCPAPSAFANESLDSADPNASCFEDNFCAVTSSPLNCESLHVRLLVTLNRFIGSLRASAAQRSSCKTSTGCDIDSKDVVAFCYINDLAALQLQTIISTPPCQTRHREVISCVDVHDLELVCTSSRTAKSSGPEFPHSDSKPF